MRRRIVKRLETILIGRLRSSPVRPPPRQEQGRPHDLVRSVAQVMRSKSQLKPSDIALCRARPCQRIPEAVQIYNVSRNRIYSLMGSGEIKFKKVGSATLLNTKSLERVFVDDE
jgi:hypothetical protein